MIRVKGQDAVNEAFWYLGESPNLPKAAFFRLTPEGDKRKISPEEIQKLVASNRARPQEFMCEVPCVWDLLQGCESDRVSFPLPDLSIYPGTKVVVVQNRFFGAEICPGSRWFSISRPVYDSAVRWAKGTPVIEPEYSQDEFMNRLFPRTFLKPGVWRGDCHSLKECRLTGEHLLQIFSLPHLQNSGWEDQQKAPGREISEEYGDGLFYDRVLEDVRSACPKDSLETFP
ncbi:hypothetical protein [Leptospirillum ferriphilum]|jgi:hypothetical protein|uniref:Uncharacterized protein n=1 Tax=Leptospirillum ferriphilum YSK TaxID=1441628 RepID=A0A059XSM8_9BACT|nr:hypothetical protein [Leptospirillum ferriphilum]AIA31624.1 hypothetical protein Y981_04660 [Leptospirillum ferriphilum YSK]